MDKVEAEVMELKPKAIIMGVGLHFVLQKQKQKRSWDKYKEELRLRLRELVNISQKVIQAKKDG